MWAIVGILSGAGLLGNAVVLFISLRMQPSILSVFVAGLCCSDILSSCNSPIFVYVTMYQNDFRLPSFFCQLPLLISMATTLVTEQQVLLLSIIRHRSVRYAIESRSDISIATCRRLVICSWFISALLVTPLMYNIRVVKLNVLRSTCSVGDTGILWVKIFGFVITTMGIFLPMVLITGFCMAIVIFLLRRRSSSTFKAKSKLSRRRESHALLHLKVTVATFLVGYSIDYGIKIFLIAMPNPTATLFQSLRLFAHVVVRVTECVNPFLYYYASSEIREGARRVLSCHSARKGTSVSRPASVRQ